MCASAAVLGAAVLCRSVLWGRSVFTSIRKFLQFQLTVNFVALVVSFVGALVGGRMPLNVLQLLWVNLIMDTLGALALATETPSPKLLVRNPAGLQPRMCCCLKQSFVVNLAASCVWHTTPTHCVSATLVSVLTGLACCLLPCCCTTGREACWPPGASD